MPKSKTFDLSEHLVLRNWVRVMVACNINIKDILINGETMWNLTMQK